MIILYTERVVYKIYLLFMIEPLSKTGREGNLLNMIKVIYQNPNVSIILSNKIIDSPLKDRSPIIN